MTPSPAPGCPYCGHAWLPDGPGPHSCPACRHALVLGRRADDAAWLPGEVEAYKLDSPAGGTLFRLRDQAVVAIRFLPGFATADPTSRERVDRDLGQLEGMEHPNLARILSHGSEAGVRYYFREWVHGADLASTLAGGVARRELMSFDEIYPLFRQLCRALQALHERGLVHGRVALSRLILAPDGTLKLTDPAWPLTPARDGIAVGREPFAAPRDFSPPTRDARDDVRAAGRAIYESLTGFPPGEPARPSALVNLTVPNWFDEILLSMLAADPSARPFPLGPLADRKLVAAGPSRAVERAATAIAGGLIGAIAGAVTAGMMSANIPIGGLCGVVPGALMAVLLGMSSGPDTGRGRIRKPNSFPDGPARTPSQESQRLRK